MRIEECAEQNKTKNIHGMIERKDSISRLGPPKLKEANQTRT